MEDSTTTLVVDRPLMDTQQMRDTAADLLVALWPRPASATVHMDNHQWIALRRLLCSIVDSEVGS